MVSVGTGGVLKGMVIGSHFGPRLPDPVLFFGRIRQKIGLMFLSEFIPGFDWRDFCDFRAKNIPL
jgi:hypothetical protein